MSWIRNTGYNYVVYNLTWACPASPQGSQWGPFPLRRCRLRHRGARKHRNRTRYRKHFVPETPSGKPTKISFLISIFLTRCWEKIKRVRVRMWKFLRIQHFFAKKQIFFFWNKTHAPPGKMCANAINSYQGQLPYFLLHVSVALSIFMDPDPDSGLNPSFVPVKNCPSGHE